MADHLSADRFEEELLAAVPFLRAFGRTLTGDTEQAEDLSQETVLQAWRCRDQFHPGTNLRAWLSTILRNRFYSTQRRRKWRAECCCTFPYTRARRNQASTPTSRGRGCPARPLPRCSEPAKPSPLRVVG